MMESTELRDLFLKETGNNIHTLDSKYIYWLEKKFFDYAYTYKKESDKDKLINLLSSVGITPSGYTLMREGKTATVKVKNIDYKYNKCCLIHESVDNREIVVRIYFLNEKLVTISF